MRPNQKMYTRNLSVSKPSLSACLESLDCTKNEANTCLRFLCESHALFIELANTFFSKNNFKIRSYDIIHTFKNYFAPIFSVFSNKRYPNRILGYVW